MTPDCAATRLLRLLLLLSLLRALAWRPVLVAAQTTATTPPPTDSSANQATAWLISRTGGSLRIEWAISSNWTAVNNESDVVSFRVFQNATQVGTANASARTYSLYGLTNNTVYSFQVKAMLAADSSAPPLETNIVVAATGNQSSPAQPDPPAVAEVGGGFVRVLARLPLDSGGASLKTLTLSARSTLDYVTVSLTQPVAQPEFVLYGLSARTRYVLSVSATNADGLSGPESDFVEATTTALQPAGACPPPTVLQTTGGSVTLKIHPPVDDGGARIRGYIVYMASNGSSDFQEVVNTVGSDTPDIVEVLRMPGAGDSPLQPTSRYDFKAVAVNNVDLSVELAKPINMNGAQLTGFLVKLNDSVVNFVATNDSVVHDINFLSAETAGGVDVTAYGVTLVSSGKSERRTTTSTSLQLSTLVATTVYAVKVTAINKVGKESSAVGTPGVVFETAVATPPSAPWELTLVASTGGSIEVGWNVPIDSGGVPLDDVLYNVTLFSMVSCFQLDSSNTTVFQALDHSTLYYVGVKASNFVGASAFSTIAGFRTTNATPPGFSRRLRQTNRTGGSVQLDWDSPLDSGGSTIIGYRVYRDYALVTSQLVFPPFTDCGGLTASTQYIYGVTAVSSASRGEGAMASGVFMTGPLTAPLPPAISLSKIASSWLSVSIAPSCDTGGAVLPSYYFAVQQVANGAVIRSSQFACCSFLIDALSADQAYAVSVYASNAVGQSAQVETELKTRLGTPAAPSIRLKRANTYSLALEIDAPVPMDYEITSYDVSVFLSDTQVHAETLSCKAAAADQRQLECPRSLVVRSLMPLATYSVHARANSALGSSELAQTTFQTANESIGAFELLPMSNTSVSAGGVATAIVHRVGGTAGAASVSVNVTQPDNVVLRCNCTTSAAGDCDCGVYLASTNIASQPGTLHFDDGDEYKSVSLSVWDEDYSLVQPLSVVLELFGSSSPLALQKQALVRIDQSQRPGLVSFVHSSTHVFENASFVKLRLARLNGSLGAIRFDVETFDVTSGASAFYVPVRKTIEFSDRQTLASLWVRILNDIYYRGTRTFGVRLLGGNSTEPMQRRANTSIVTRRVVVLDDEDVSRTLPDAPVDVRLARATGGELELEWTSANTSTNTSTPVGGFIVRVSRTYAMSFVSLYNTTEASFTLSSLPPYSTYAFEVAAWNQFGRGAFAAPVMATTTAPTPPSAPTAVQVTSVSNNALQLAWREPLFLGGSLITGYVLKIATATTEAVTVGSVSAPVNSTTASFELTQLDASTAYEVSITAMSEAFPVVNESTAAYANVTVTTTAGTVPSQPPRVTQLAPATAGTLTLQLGLPSDLGGLPILDFALHVRRVESDGALPLAPASEDATATSFSVACTSASPRVDGKPYTCRVYKLLAGSSYEAFATFSNVAGESVAGVRAVFSTPATLGIPSAPLNFRVARATAGNIELAWDVPMDLGGAPDVIGYLVFQRFDLFANKSFVVYDGQSSLARSVVVRALTRNTVYAFSVVALNTASYCVDSNSLAVSALLTVSTLAYSQLAAPASAFFITRTGGSVTFGWTPPDDLAGVPLLGYQVANVSDDGSVTTTIADLPAGVTTFTQFGLAEKTVYNVLVYARNQDGLGYPSSILSVATAVCSTPSAVQNIRVLGATGGQILLAWDAPMDSGGRAIVYYEVNRLERSGGGFVSSSAHFTDFYSLTANSVYTYEIRPFNGLYLGIPNYIGASTTGATVPQSLLFTSVVAFGGRIEAAWDAPEDVGGAVHIEFAIALYDQNRTVLTSFQSTAMNYTFASLKASTLYYLVGKVVTLAGESPSVEYPVTTTSPDHPGAPPTPTVSDIRGGSAVLTVALPSYDGGESVSLALYQDGEHVYDFAPQELSHTVYELTALTQYAFDVAAINSAGRTRGSALFVTTGPISTPGAVIEVVEVDLTHDMLLLMWEYVVDTGGDAALAYQVTFFKCAEDGSPLNATQVVVVSENAVELTKLDFSSYYSVRVAAITTTGLLGTASPVQLFRTQDPFSGRVVAQFSEMTVREGATNVSVPVLRIDGSFGDSHFSYTTRDESAVAGVNYASSSGTMTLTTNIKYGLIAIPIIDDALYQPNTTFVVMITDEVTSLSTETRVVVMDNGDAGFLSFTSAALEFLENSGEVALTITRTGGATPPAVVQALIMSERSAISSAVAASRFEIVEPMLSFTDGVTSVTVRLKINDDSEYQFTRDSANISFAIVEGGSVFGTFSSVNVSAVDDGDISPPKQCTGLALRSVSGGYMELEWTPPLDRGGERIPLLYDVDFRVKGDLVLSVQRDIESGVIYGLNASTTYDVSVRAINSVDTSLPSRSSLLTTTVAVRASAPRNVTLLAASSSTILLSWDVPIDDGGSRIVNYKIYNVLPTTGALVQFSQVSCTVPTICLVKGLSALTHYMVQVRATTFLVSNGTLSEPLLLQTSNPDVPDPPPHLTVTDVTAGAISVAMHDPLNIGGSEIRSYRLFRMEDGETEFMMVYEGASSTHTLYRLKRKTTYQLKYQVVNIVGPSGFSPVSTVVTLERSLPSAPRNVTIQNVTGGAARLSWEEPLDIGGRDIVGYRIMLNSTTVGGNGIIGYDGKRDPVREGIVYGLTASTNYTMYVFAFTEISSCYQQSDWVSSRVVSVRTLAPTLPGTAPLLLLSRYTGGIIELTWTEPKDTGGVPITGYVLYSVSVVGSLNAIFAPAAPNVYSYIDRNLTESTAYSYIVIASNVVGESPPSVQLTRKTTPASPPSAPLNVRQLAFKTGGAVEIGWDRPIDSGGQPLAGYLIYRDGAALPGELPASALSFVDKTNLASTKSYEYTIRSFSASSLGSEFSAICTATTATATKPQVPILVNATAGASTLEAYWMADPDTGGVPIKLFDVKLLLNSTVVGSYTGLSTSNTFRGLLASRVYTLSVVAYNDIGPSAVLLANRTTLAVALPAAPLVPFAVSVHGGNFTLELTAPIEQGGAAITAITVFEKTRGQLATVKLPSGAFSARYTMYDVLRETSYVMSCSATNALGTGPVSPSVIVRTAPQSAPGAIPAPPAFVEATGTSLTMVWIEPADTGGDPLDVSYELRVVGPDQQALVFPIVKRSGTAAGLKYDTLYAVSVRARNKVGVGMYSPPSAVRTQPDAAGEFNLVNTTAVVPVLENATQVSLLVQRTNGLSGRVALEYKAVVGPFSPATIGVDFALTLEPASATSATSTIYFDDLQVAANITVFILNDALYERPDEMFSIQLVSATGASSNALAKIGANKTARVAIVDDVDAGYIGFDLPTHAFLEGVQIAVIPIVREQGSSGQVVLAFAFGNGTAALDRDYRRFVGVITLEDGVTNAELKVPIINDRVFESPDETFYIQMQVVSGGAVLRQSTTLVRILDDGDTSLPGDSSPPVVANTTGGAVTLAIELPAHNGSAKGQLSGYIVRLNSSVSSVDLALAPRRIVQLGNLTALTTYQVAVAAVNPIGSGNFSDATEFTTGDPSLPGPISRVETREQAGGRLKLFWYAPDDTGGIPITKYRVYLLDALGLPHVVATNLDPTREATVFGLNATTQYSFVVQAGNLAPEPVFAGGWGSVSPVFNFSTGEPTLPGPTSVYPDQSSTPTGGSIPLRWDMPRDTGGVPITGFNVYARNVTSPFRLLRERTNDTRLSGRISTLYAHSWYQSFVLPQNGLPPMDVPGNLSIISGSRVAQTTSDLSRWLTTGAVLSIVDSDSYVVVGNMSTATKSVVPLFAAHTSASLTSRKARLIGHTFSFVNMSTTDARIPSAPPAPALVRATGGLFELVLESPDDTGGIIVQDFDVYMNGIELDGDALDKVVTKSELKISTTISVGDLEPLTTYTFQVVGVNALSLCYFGEEAKSEAVQFQTTNTTPPGRPTLVPKRETGAGITLNLVHPRDKGGHPVVRYQLYYKESSGESDEDTSEDAWILGYNGSVREAEIAKLKSQTEYVFKFSVFNGFYESPNSSTLVRATTPPSAPGACASPRLVSATGGMLNVSWELPNDDGGAPVTGYLVTLALDSDGSGKVVRSVTGLSYAFYGLRQLSDYRVVVRAENSKGRGPESNPVTYSTLNGTAPAGAIDVVVQTTTGGAAVIAFNEPIDLGGASPLDVVYRVFVDRENRLNLTSADLQSSRASSTAGNSRRLSEVDVLHRRLAPASFSGVLVGGLDPEGVYNIQVLPISVFGSGSTTKAAPATTTAPTVTSNPLGLASATVTGGSVTMTWTAPVDSGGALLKEYVLFMATTSSAGPFSVACIDTPTQCAVNRLAPATEYWFYVLARNEIGDSPPSSTVSVTTKAVSPPSAPVNARITIVGHDSVDCTWEIPDDLGGSTIASYTVVVERLDGASTVSVPETRTFVTVSSLAPSVAYSITLVATNQDGDSSDPSLPLYFTTSASANSLPAPQLGCVSQTTVSLLWLPFRGATTYHVLRNGVSIYSGPLLAVVDTQGLVPGTQYEYEMFADFGSAVGTSSPRLAVTTLDGSAPATESQCVGSTGVVSELNYQSSSSKSWRIEPQRPFDVLTLRFTTFDLECDHDRVVIHEAASNALVWQGGCLRDTSAFLLQSSEPLAIRFTSDKSISKAGFELRYDTSTQLRQTRIPPPGGASNVCFMHGQSQPNGACKCSIGFTGEGCSSRIVCCRDRTRCSNPVCSLDPRRVIVVAGELGDDALGTGELMDASEAGTATKAVASLSKALSLSSDGDTIFVYPGAYKGSVNRNLVVTDRASLSVRAMRGSFWTRVDCEQLGRALDIDGSTLSVDGLAFYNCVGPSGAAMRVANSQLTLLDTVIADAAATERGGALYSSESVVAMSDSSFVNCSASSSGGGVYLTGSTLTMTRSNITDCSAVSGGAVALEDVSSVTGVASNLTGNSASVDGGAIAASGDAAITGLALLWNNASVEGGAVAVSSGQCQITNAVVANNRAGARGGGLAFVGQVDATIIGSAVRANHAGGSGGGVHFQGQGALVLAMAQATGAGIHIVDSSLRITGGRVLDGVANATDGGGGGIAVTGSAVALAQIEIASNRALSSRGAGMLIETSTIECTGSVAIRHNGAATGGGVWMSASTFRGNDFAIVDNNTATRTGGGLYAQDEATVSAMAIQSSHAPQGGGIHFFNANVALSSVSVANCSASVSGGNVFASNSNVTATAAVVLKDGRAADGGGMHAVNSAVTGQVKIQNCTATDAGGGVYVGGTSSLVDTEVTLCRARAGGGVAVSSLALELKNVRVTQSRATVKGGGLYATGSTIVAEDSVFERHSSGDTGGAMMLEGSSLHHKNVNVTDSVATTGGGVYLYSSSLVALPDLEGLSLVFANSASSRGGNVFATLASTLERLEIAGGHAELGGGVAFSDAQGSVKSCLIDLNTAASLGGGVHISTASFVQFESAEIFENMAENGGGGGLAIVDSQLSHADLSIYSNAAPKGGGIFASGVVELHEDETTGSNVKCQVHGNALTDGPGIGAAMFMDTDCRLNASSFVFSGGRADNGGGIYVSGGQLWLTDSSVSSNVVQLFGGGIYLDAHSDLSLVNCDIASNTAYQLGGGIASSGAATGAMNTITLENCRLTSNRAVESGGGIMLSRTNLSGKNLTFTRNLVRDQEGGGVAALTEGDVEIIDSNFFNNTVGSGKSVRGGSLAFDGGAHAVVANCSILSNPNAALASTGGLIYVKGVDTSVQILHSTLSDGQSFAGGLLYAEDATVSMRNCSLLNGWANNFGGGIFTQNARLDIRDSRIAGNIAYYDGGGVFMRTGGSLALSNVRMHGNICQDRGGALFFAPGAGVVCNVTDSVFTFNRNYGYGSTVFLGRKNALAMRQCALRNNGDANNEGGAVYAVDAAVTIDSTLFESNYGLKGAAIELSRDAALTMANVTLRNNSVDVWGGALYLSMRATALVRDSLFESNRATEGGALYSIGSARVAFENVELRGNTALSFGGGVSMRANAQLGASRVTFSANRGHTGGALSVVENASLALTSGVFAANQALDFGGAVYIDTTTSVTENLLRCSRSVFSNNNATAGADVYWVFSKRFSFFECADSTSTTSATGKLSASTSATSISAGWWPSTVTSGVSLGVTKTTNLSSLATPDDVAAQAMATNKELSRPNDAVMWPTVVIRDFYGEIARHDNVSWCTVKRVADSASGRNESFAFSPSYEVAVRDGYVTFDAAKVFSDSRTEPYVLGITCQLASDLERFTSVQVVVEPCKTGYQNVDGLCIPCKKGYYSLDGVKCYLCPLGATCEQPDSVGTPVGVSTPIRVAGYYLWGSRDSYLSTGCSSPSTWELGDPCRNVSEQNMTYRIQKCSKLENFDKYWSRKRIFACLSGKEYYPCDTYSACVKEQTEIATTTANALSSQQCLVGYTGVMCATCVDDYYKVSNGMCKPCSDPTDPAVARIAHLLATVPIGIAVVALALTVVYFWNASEREVLKHATAAKKFQVYDLDARPVTLLRAATSFAQQRAHELIHRISARVHRPRQTQHLFQIAPQAAPRPAFRAEKFKIMLGFFQIFGGFKKVYEIPWPSEMSRLVDVFSIADFSLVDTTGIECFVTKNYFKNYRLSLIVVLVLLAFTGFVLVWGVVRYRVMLSTLPRHCVRCGLPVFKLLKREAHTVARRSTLLLKLRAEQKDRQSRLQRRSFSTRMRAKVWTRTEAVLDRIRTWWVSTRAGQGIHRLVTFSRLPASSSEHFPTCPTSHHIQSGDVLGMVVRSNLRLWRARIRLRLNYQSYQNKCAKLFFWILLLFYPELSQRVMGLFYCEEIGAKWYMSRDKSLLCYEGEWLYYLPLTVGLIVIWVIGVPLLFWLLLFLKRRSGVNEKLLLLDEPANAQLKQRLLREMRADLASRGLHFDDEKLAMFEKDLLAEFLYNKKLNEPSMVAQVGFIYHSYDTRFWWFEVWDLGRKLFLTSIISLLAKTGANRIIAGLLVFLIYLSVMLFYQPYKERSDSALAGVTQIQLFVTLFCGLILKMGSLYLEPGVVTMLSYVTLVSNIATLLYAVFSIVYEKIDAARKLQRRVRDEHRRAIRAHVIKLWRRAYGFAFTEVYLRDETIRPMPVHVILELARRDRKEREAEALRAQLELTTAAIGHPHDARSTDGGGQSDVRGASQVDVALTE